MHSEGDLVVSRKLALYGLKIGMYPVALKIVDNHHANTGNMLNAGVLFVL